MAEPRRALAFIWILSAIVVIPSRAGQGGGGTGKVAGNNAGGSGGGSGASYTIESQLLGYKSLESDAAAIACDIALVLGFANAPSPGQADFRKGCPQPGGIPNRAKVVIGSASTFSTFQAYQGQMTIAHFLLERESAVESTCIPTSSGPTRAGASPSDVLNDSQAAVTLLQSMLSLFATNETVNGSAGSIQDQALINAVARQLRTMGIRVLIPDTFSPKLFSTGGQSPLFNLLIRLIATRNCLQSKANEDLPTITRDTAEIAAAEGNPQADQTQLSAREAQLAILNIRQLSLISVISAIDQFVNAITGTPSQQSGQGSNASGLRPQGSTPAGSPTNGAQQGNPGNNAGVNAPLIASLVGADELAQALQFRGEWEAGASYSSGDVVTNKQNIYEAKDMHIAGADFPTDLPHWGSSTWFVLDLKVIESGGGTLTKGNIVTGNRIYFSGGAAATYSLFDTAGELKCSANLYDFEGNVREKKLLEELRNKNFDPSKQSILVRGGCEPQQ